jgi:hypothetical protein
MVLLVITFCIILLKYNDYKQVRLIIHLVFIDKTDFTATYITRSAVVGPDGPVL